MNDIVLLKPLKENEEEFIKILASNYEIDIKLLKALKDYFKEDFYLILSLFAGQSIKFSSIKDMNDIKVKIKIYKDFNESNKILTEKLEDLSDKYKVSQNQIYEIYKEIRGILNRGEDK
jgi:Mor family transcriptional regulator